MNGVRTVPNSHRCVRRWEDEDRSKSGCSGSSSGLVGTRTNRIGVKKEAKDKFYCTFRPESLQSGRNLVQSSKQKRSRKSFRPESLSDPSSTLLSGHKRDNSAGKSSLDCFWVSELSFYSAFRPESVQSGRKGIGASLDRDFRHPASRIVDSPF